jgi:hypothetical protein
LVLVNLRKNLPVVLFLLKIQVSWDINVLYWGIVNGRFGRTERFENVTDYHWTGRNVPQDLCSSPPPLWEPETSRVFFFSADWYYHSIAFYRRASGVANFDQWYKRYSGLMDVLRVTKMYLSFVFSNSAGWNRRLSPCRSGNFSDRSAVRVV